MLQRKTPLKSKSSLQTKTALTAKKPMSKKRSKRARAKEFSDKVKLQVRERSNGVCEYCGRQRGQHYHHATFRSQQGTGELSNCILLCIDCHNMAHKYPEVREQCVTIAQQAAGKI